MVFARQSTFVDRFARLVERACEKIGCCEHRHEFQSLILKQFYLCKIGLTIFRTFHHQRDFAVWGRQPFHNARPVRPTSHALSLHTASSIRARQRLGEFPKPEPGLRAFPVQGADRISKKIMVAGIIFNSANAARRSPPREGKNPANRNRSLGNPDRINPASGAEAGRGWTQTGICSASTARTSL